MGIQVKGQNRSGRSGFFRWYQRFNHGDQRRALPCTNPMASRAASSMCCKRTRSSLRILNLRFPQHILAEISAQILGGAQIDFSPTKDRRELPFHARDTEKPRHVRGLEIHKHITPVVGCGRADVMQYCCRGRRCSLGQCLGLARAPRLFCCRSMIKIVHSAKAVKHRFPSCILAV